MAGRWDSPGLDFALVEPRVLFCDRILLSLAIQLFIQQILEALLCAQKYSRHLRHTSLNKMVRTPSPLELRHSVREADHKQWT